MSTIGNNGNDENRVKREALRSKLQVLKNTLAEAEKVKKPLLNALKDNKDALKRKIDEVSAAKEKLPFKSTKEVDLKIQALEKSLETQSLKLIEEKKIVADISKLKKSKKTIEELEGQNSEIDSIRMNIENIKKSLDLKDAENAGIKQSINKIHEELVALDGDREEINKAKKIAYDERKSLQDKLNTLYQQKKDLFENNKKEQEEYRIKMDQERVKREAMKKVRDQEYQVKDLEKALHALDRPAFDEQVDKCVQLMNYLLSNFVKDAPLVEAPAKVPEKKPSSSLNIRQVESIPAGVALPKKGQNEEVFYMGSAPKKTLKTKTPSSKSPASSSFKLPLHVITGLSELHISIPPSVQEVPKCIEVLKAKKAEFEKEEEKRNSEIDGKKSVIEKELEEARRLLKELSVGMPASE